jgi:hypothetical protein
MVVDFEFIIMGVLMRCKNYGKWLEMAIFYLLKGIVLPLDIDCLGK